MPPLHTSHVDDDSATFRSRTFLVRYSNEMYDLNDGVHFRLTMPDVDISLFYENSEPITAPEPVTLVFELCFSGFTKDVQNGNPDHMDHPNYDSQHIVPVNPTFIPVASQTLKIPQFASGLQEYYPIHFEKGSYVQLDMMLHLAATSIRIENICFEEGDNSDDTQSISTSVTTGTDDSQELNSAQTVFFVAGQIVKRGPETTRIETPHIPVQSTFQMLSRKMTRLSKYRPGEGKFRAAVAKKLSIGGATKSSPSSSPSAPERDSNTEDFTSASSSNTNPGITRPTRISITSTSTPFLSSSGFSKAAIEDVYEKLYRVVVNNQIVVERMIKFSVDLYDIVAKSSTQSGSDGSTVVDFFEDSLMPDNYIVDDETQSPAIDRKNYECCNIFEAVKSKSKVVDEMMKLNTTSELSGFLVSKFEDSNAETLNRWLTITKILPKVTRYMKAKLRPTYILHMRGFWKLSMMVHTCGSSNITRTHSEDDRINKDFLTILNSESADARAYMDIVYGFDSDSSGRQTSLATSPTISPSSPTSNNKKHIYIFYSSILARNLKVYDRKLELTATLPYLIFQQYLSPTISIETSHIRAGCLLGCLDEVQLLKQSQEEEEKDLIAGSAVKFRYTCVDNLDDGEAVLDHPTVIEKLNETNPSVIKQKNLPSGAVSLIGSCRVKASANQSSVSFVSRRPSSVEISAALTSNQKLAQAARKGPHLVILQHGFEGSSFDMRILKSHLLFVFPTLRVHCAEGNNDKTHDSIDEMGIRLATDIHNFIRKRVPDLQYENSPGRISFIGHSMGGLIIRRALQEESMQKYLKKMHVFVTLATPHLGTSYAQSQLVASGQWAMMKWYKCQSLKQLSLDDVSSGDIQNSCMYKLSSSTELGSFKRVICFDSPLDMYVPSYSARIQVPSKADLDPVNGQAIIQMAFNMMESIIPENLVRVTLLNCIGRDSREVDKLIGRTAHICYLDNAMVAEEIIHSLIPYFS